MTNEAVSDRILTIPNLVSFARLLAVPFFWWVLFARDDVGLAAVIIVVVAWTDWVDGFLARRLDQVSRLGRNLDPIADRIMIASAVVGGLIVEVVPSVIGVPLIIRELFMGIVTLVMVSRGAGTLTVRYLGKFATAAVYSSIPSFYFAQAGIFDQFFGPFAWFTGIIGLITYFAAAALYVGDARHAIADVESRQTDQES